MQWTVVAFDANTYDVIAGQAFRSEARADEFHHMLLNRYANEDFPPVVLVVPTSKLAMQALIIDEFDERYRSEEECL